MQFVPYLNFDGTCAEAMAFYAQLFGGQIVYQGTFGDMPASPGMPPLPDAAKQRIMHAHLQVGAQAIMASDTMPVIAAKPSISVSAASKTCSLSSCISLE